jgi:hypothetical protein
MSLLSIFEVVEFVLEALYILIRGFSGTVDNKLRSQAK